MSRNSDQTSGTDVQAFIKKRMEQSREYDRKYGSTFPVAPARQPVLDRPLSREEIETRLQARSAALGQVK